MASSSVQPASIAIYNSYIKPPMIIIHNKEECDLFFTKASEIVFSPLSSSLYQDPPLVYRFGSEIPHFRLHKGGVDFLQPFLMQSYSNVSPDHHQL
ncbi:hypothetical protein DVH24_015561 [Malus domestica]|uniref:Uncharacterized protein n=1 Tax=Malus domestica TaxID=3750 RepID=A0A498HIW6_MALDO|nr:hypothetical protein DVH24_015561 [Malus domestica]